VRRIRCRNSTLELSVTERRRMDELGEAEEDSWTYSSADSEDEDGIRTGFGIVQCLPVEECDPDWTEYREHEPISLADLTVEEYLRRVRFQAHVLPNVVKVDVDEMKWMEREPQRQVRVETHAQDSPLSDDRSPGLAWIRSFIAQFMSLRQDLENARVDSNAISTRGLSDQSLLGLGQVALQKLLEEEADAIERDGAKEARVRMVYDISALLDWPCHGDTLATIRRLVRVCSGFRDKSPRPADRELALLNIVIVICGGIFRQDEHLAGLFNAELL
jgi:hypothetical protein